jgi:hypothetical protein
MVANLPDYFQPFEDIAETEAARYKKEMEAYRKQAGLE